MRVKGPNGLVLDFPDSVAEGLLKSEGHERVEDEKPKSESKSTAKKSSSTKK